MDFCNQLLIVDTCETMNVARKVWGKRAIYQRLLNRNNTVCGYACCSCLISIGKCYVSIWANANLRGLRVSTVGNAWVLPNVLNKGWWMVICSLSCLKDCIKKKRSDHVLFYLHSTCLYYIWIEEKDNIEETRIPLRNIPWKVAFTKVKKNMALSVLYKILAIQSLTCQPIPLCETMVFSR